MRLAMPQLGESVTEGTIIKWLKHVGEPVGLDEPLVEIETEKVNVEVPSPWQGVLSEVLVPEGETVSVGTELATIEEDPASPAALASPLSASRGDTQDETNKAATRHPSPTQSSGVSGAMNRALANGGGAGARQRYSPAVLRLAEEHDIDLTAVPGSGLGGRVTRKDVASFLAGRGGAYLIPQALSLDGKGVAEERAAEQPSLQAIQESAATPAQAGRAPAPAGSAPAPEAVPTMPTAEDEELIHPSPTRRAIAAHMVRSVQTSPHAWMVVEVDLTRLVRFRESVKASFREREGVDLSYLPFMIKATVLALTENPRLNASWREGEIVLKRRINIGIAVNTDEGLTVPVIHDADNYSIAGLARVTADLAARARSRRLRLEEVQGGTCTVDNTGVFGSVVSAPIINQPQAAIVTMEAIVKRPVVVRDAIAIRSMMNSCISFDHRVVDGGEVGPFMQSLKRHLESFGPETALY